jgi:hypothetical protein
MKIAFLVATDPEDEPYLAARIFVFVALLHNRIELE